MMKTAITVFLCLIMISLLGCNHVMGQAVPYMPGPKGPYGADVDNLYPRGKILREYERALALYKQGRSVEGLKIVRGVASQQLRLAPDSVIDDEQYYTAFLGGRQNSTLAMMREIWRHNQINATELAKSGKHKQALQVLVTNLKITKQMIHIQPLSLAPAIGGNALWRCTWEDISRELAAVGDTQKAKTAKRHAQKAKQFSSARFAPYIKEQQRGLDELKKIKNATLQKRKLKEIMHSEAKKERKIILLWDKEVCGTDCQKFIPAIEK